MDRRQRKTREDIFSAFTTLLSAKDFGQITVGEIIEKADVGRATFYAHFETKDYLLKALCEELFCHVFDHLENNQTVHNHIFHCDPPESGFLHLFQHLLKNDNHILELLSCQNNDLFFQYFKENLQKMVIHELPAFENRKNPQLPDSFWINHISSTFVETVRWWIDNGMKESPETITQYFYLAV
ncbi:MAG: TetR/AcrR family transcriptional regulator [Ruminococcaceae bacterium]|nr:TetR/AcrR family transcriptional regulator [Oscillospiraceae bacterium]